MFHLRRLATNKIKNWSASIRRRSCSSLYGPVLTTVTRQIRPDANIRIGESCNFNLRIKPNDILDPNDINSLRATLYSHKTSSAATDAATVQFDIDDNNVIVVTTSADKNETADDITCVLEVPVKCDLDITSPKDVHIERMHSEAIKVLTTGDGASITTHNLQSFQLQFEAAAGGNVHCGGNTLANLIHIRTRSYGVSIVAFNLLIITFLYIYAFTEHFTQQSPRRHVVCHL